MGCAPSKKSNHKESKARALSDSKQLGSGGGNTQASNVALDNDRTTAEVQIILEDEQPKGTLADQLLSDRKGRAAELKNAPVAVIDSDSEDESGDD